MPLSLTVYSCGLFLRVRGAAAADRTAGAGQSFVHDLADRARAAAALSAAAEAAIDLTGCARRRLGKGGANGMVAQCVEGKDET